MLDAITAGDTLAFTETVADYPASAGWTLTYRLVPRATGGAAITFSASASGDAYAVSVAAATTATWAAGDYGWSSYVSKGLERYSVGGGQVEIFPDPATVAVGTDRRSHAQKMLDAIEAVLQGRATSSQAEYRIGERQLKHIEPDVLEAWRDKYRREVQRELREALGIRSNDVFVRFGRV
jgi:hypothetical protein